MKQRFKTVFFLFKNISLGLKLFQIFPNDSPFFDSSTRSFFDPCNLFRSLGNTNNDQIDHETLNLFS